MRALQTALRRGKAKLRACCYVNRTLLPHVTKPHWGKLKSKHIHYYLISQISYFIALRCCRKSTGLVWWVKLLSDTLCVQYLAIKYRSIVLKINRAHKVDIMFGGFEVFVACYGGHGYFVRGPRGDDFWACSGTGGIGNILNRTYFVSPSSSLLLRSPPFPLSLPPKFWDDERHSPFFFSLSLSLPSLPPSLSDSSSALFLFPVYMAGGRQPPNERDEPSYDAICTRCPLPSSPFPPSFPSLMSTAPIEREREKGGKKSVFPSSSFLPLLSLLCDSADWGLGMCRHHPLSLSLTWMSSNICGSSSLRSSSLLHPPQTHTHARAPTHTHLSPKMDGRLRKKVHLCVTTIPNGDLNCVV